MTKGEPKLGISGYGSIGRRHAQVAAGLGWTIAVHEPGPMRGQDREDMPPGTTVVPRFEELFDHGIDALIVASPDDAHEAQAIAACEWRVPVLVEKPLAPTVGAARSIATSSARTGTPVLCGYVLRHNSALREARRLLLAGAIGTPLSFHVDLGAYETLELARSRFASAGRDRLYLDYSHEWDYLQWLFGPARRALAVARTELDLPLVQSPNVVEALLELDCASGSVHLDYVRHPPRRTITILGSSGGLDLDVPASRLTISLHTDGSSRVEQFDQERNAMFAAQLENLASMAFEGGAPDVNACDGVHALEVAEAMIASSAHERWVEVRQPGGRR